MVDLTPNTDAIISDIYSFSKYINDPATLRWLSASKPRSLHKSLTCVGDSPSGIMAFRIAATTVA